MSHGPDFEIIDDGGTVFPTDPGTPGETDSRAGWVVVVADDDPDVHDSTDFALRNERILGRPVLTLHCSAAHEVLPTLREHPDAAVLLLDVVMETVHAGLKIVRDIRDAGFLALRIVLRTGQPGYAPEVDVLTRYDINDYRTKTELDKARLVSVLTTATRAYHQMALLRQGRRGLEMVIDGTIGLLGRSSVDVFAAGVLTQLSNLFCAQATDSTVCVVRESEEGEDIYNALEFVVGSGRFANRSGDRLAAVVGSTLREPFERAKSSGVGLSVDRGLAVYVAGANGSGLFAYAEPCDVLPDGFASLAVLFARNVGLAFENVALVDRLSKMAYEDFALGVPNMNAFVREFERLATSGASFSLVVVRIMNIDEITGTFGEQYTVRVLRELYRTLSREPELAAHFVGFQGSGDFLLLVDPEFRADQVRTLVEGLVPVNRDQVWIHPSIAVVPNASMHGPVDSRKHAMATMFYARDRGLSSVAAYDPEISAQISRHHELRGRLRRSLSDDVDLTVALQPKVDCASRRIVGAEALARWSIDGEPVSPAEFIPVAETSGLTGQLADRVLARVATVFRRMGVLPRGLLSISVNLSMYDVQSPGYGDHLRAIVRHLGIPAEFLVFEVTETAIMGDPELAITTLQTLRNAGFGISIDDFGTGYSSLSYVDRIPATELKIDRAFVQDLTPGNVSDSVLGTAIAIARSRHLHTVAEGVETEPQHEALLEIGCDTAQGYLYGRPVSDGEFLGLFGG